MNIMISINREYMKYACVMLMSLKQHHKDVLLSVYILHSELTGEDFQKMDEIIGSEGIELIPVFIPKGTVKEFQIGNWPEEAAYRLLATDLFQGSVERILHLDVDTLIMGDISEFYNTPFEEHYLAACEDFLTFDEKRQKCRGFGRDESVRLFNSGVILFNIPKLSADGFCYAVFADILRKYPNIKIEYPDQDILNLLFCDKTKYMDRMKYNYAPFFYKISDSEHFYDSREALAANCRIIHMYGGSKPWENIDRMAADQLWWEYAERTPFYVDMKMKHVQSMLHKEQKINSLLDKQIRESGRDAGAIRQIVEAEGALYQIIERELLLAEQLGEAL